MESDNIQLVLGRILATQELILTKMDKQHLEQKELERRVNSIDRKFHYLYGFSAAVIGAFTFTSDIILTKIGLK